MKRKNKVEQELDQKEFENQLERDLSSEYEQRSIREKLREGTNPYVLGLMHFLSSFLFFQVLYFLIKWNLNFFTIGATVTLFANIDLIVQVIIMGISLDSIRRKRSAVDFVIDHWPF